MSYKKFTKDIGIVGITQLITMLRGFILLPIITKLLGAENYGIWTQITVTIGLVTPVIVLGLPYSLVRFLAGEKDRKEITEQQREFGVENYDTLIGETLNAC